MLTVLHGEHTQGPYHIISKQCTCQSHGWDTACRSGHVALQWWRTGRERVVVRLCLYKFALGFRIPGMLCALPHVLP